MIHTVESLLAFERRVKEAFLAGLIRAPVHLSGGNEAQLLSIFRHLRPQDWVFSGWRSHYHALLKGVPEEWVFAEILAGRSMALMNAEHRFFCSSIVGGILPIALGVAAGLKREWDASWPGKNTRVWVFVGDMTARTGLFHEFTQYASGHGLPVEVVIEDNGMSTDSPTEETWGAPLCNVPLEWVRYHYERTQPHVGVGQHVEF